MGEPKFTADEICTGIASAIKAHDFPAVIGLLKLLALQDPHQAEVVYTSLLAVLDGSDEGSGSHDGTLQACR